jgi:superfamily II DNA or RNA helicase
MGSENMIFELRPYQKDIIESVLNTDKDTLIQIPTGGGKTVISKEIIRSLINDGLQVLFVAPKKVLMNQTVKEFKELDPHIIHGINEYDKNHLLLVSTNQTACRREVSPDVIFIDEIHYGFDGKMISFLLKDKTNIRLIGLSATPYDKNGKLLNGFGCVLDKYDIAYMINNKYLVDIKSYELVKIYNLDKVKVTGGDYNLSDLSKIVSNNQTILEIVNTTFDYIHEHKKAIVFAVDINHAELLTKAYQHEGFIAKALHSKMKTEEIDKEIKLFRNNETKILVSVLMLTTGFDVPDTDVAIIARPTKSQNLYKQMVGRVLRLAEGKTHAILLDCGNVIENLGLPLEPIKEKVLEETVNVNKCKRCKSENLKLQKKDGVSRWVCKDCGFYRDIQEGVYECKICKKTYTHDAKFDMRNNKLYLVCPDCPYPTLISEFTGEEKFVEVNDGIKRYLPLDDARRYVRSLKLSSFDEWQNIVKGAEEGKKELPTNIPLYPKEVYHGKGWKNFYDWLGLVKKLEISEEPKWNNKKKDEEIVKNNKQQLKYLPFEEAREYVRSLNLKVKKNWINFIKDIENGEKEFSKNVPTNPQVIYKNKGWIDIKDWLNFEQEKESQKVPELDEKYLSFEEAKSFIHSLKLTSTGDWANYKKNQLKGYEPKPENIPDKPQTTYKKHGWKDFNDWIGLDLIIKGYLDELTESIYSKDIDKIYDYYKKSSKLNKDGSNELILTNLDIKGFTNFISKFHYVDKFDFMNTALSLNETEKFLFLSNESYEIEHTYRFDENYKREELDKPYFTTHKLISHINENVIINFLKSFTDAENKILDCILQNLNDVRFDIKVVMLFELVKQNKYGIGKKVIESGLTLENINDNIDQNEDTIKAIIKMYPNQWKTFNIVDKLDYIEENSKDGFFDIHSLGNFKDILPLIENNEVKIYFDSGMYDFIDYLNTNSLTNNYMQEKDGNVIILKVDKFMTDFILYLLSLNNDTDELDFLLSIVYDFDIKIIKALYKDKFNKETFETEKFNKLVKPIDVAKRLNNIDIIKFLEDKHLV